MICIKESNKRYPHWMEKSLNRTDALGHKGVDVFEKEGVQFVNDGSATFGISWHGDSVKDMNRDDTYLFRGEPPIYNLFFGWSLNSERYLKQFKGVISTYKIPLKTKVREQKDVRGGRRERPSISDSLVIVPVDFQVPYNIYNTHFDKDKTDLLCMVLRNKSLHVKLNSLIPYHRKFNKYSNMKFRKTWDNFFSGYYGTEHYHSYGSGWNPKCFKGNLPERWSQLDVFSKHMFTFCPENCSIEGHISEKPLLAMLCGSVPIYKGPPDVYKYLKAGTFIDANRYMPDFSLLNPEEYHAYRKRIKQFITSKECDAFSSVTFAKRLLKIVG